MLYIGCLIILSIYVSINSFICYVSKNNFLEQHVYNNMLFMSLSLDCFFFFFFFFFGMS